MEKPTNQYPKLIFGIALKCWASEIVLAPHPSGSLKPSHADISVTRKLKGADYLLDMYEHLIITAEGYYSFADDGML